MSAKKPSEFTYKDMKGIQFETTSLSILGGKHQQCEVDFQFPWAQIRSKQYYSRIGVKMSFNEIAETFGGHMTKKNDYTHRSQSLFYT